MKTPWAGMVLSLGLLVGLTTGCSDEADPSAVDTTSTQEDTAEASSEDDRSAEELAADQAAAEEIVLTLDDFDPGWEASPAEDEGSDAEMEAEVAEAQVELMKDEDLPTCIAEASGDFLAAAMLNPEGGQRAPSR